MVPVGAQSINLVSELEQESRSNQVGVVLDAAVNLVVVELEGKRLVAIILGIIIYRNVPGKCQ